MELFLPITGVKSRKSDWNWQIWLQTSLSNYVHSYSDVKSQRRCQHLTNALGGMGICAWNWLSHYNQFMSMQPSLTTMKTLTASKKALHWREIKRSHRRVARKRRSGSKVQRKKVGALHFLPPHSFATFTCHSKLRGCSQSCSVNQLC